MVVKQGRFYLRHNTLSEDIPIAIIFKVIQLLVVKNKKNNNKKKAVLQLKNEDWWQLSEVSMYRRTWQGLENARFFPWRSHPYCTAKRRKSAAFFCKKSIAVARQMPATPLLFCKVPLHCCLCSCCYRKSEGFWFFLLWPMLQTCVKGLCFWFWSSPPPTCGLLSSSTPFVSDPGTWHSQELVIHDFQS